jgi:fused signal recognition particle receptor
MSLVLVLILVGIVVLALAGTGVAVSSRSRRLRSPEAPPAAVTTRPGAPTGPMQVERPPSDAPPVPEAPPEPVSAPAPRPALRDRLGKARQLLGGYLDGIRSKAVDDATFDELEEALLLADVGVTTTTKVLDDLRAKVRSGQVEKTPEALLAALRADLEAIFEGDEPTLVFGVGPTAPAAAGAQSDEGGTDGDDSRGQAHGPTVWLFVGVNGVGKTTTIGKLAARERADGHKVVLAAGDTFRAAAGEQLETWAERSGATLVRGAEGADPSSVIFDAVAHAAARGADLVLADTAGRLHTKVNLMEELRKVRRIADRPPGQLTEVLLVLDATTGQNGLVQAKQFTEAVGVTGVVLTKLDGTAKGGVVLAIRSELGLPIKLVGVGETSADLIEFDPAEFVAALFG